MYSVQFALEKWKASLTNQIAWFGNASKCGLWSESVSCIVGLCALMV